MMLLFGIFAAVAGVFIYLSCTSSFSKIELFTKITGAVLLGAFLSVVYTGITIAWNRAEPSEAYLQNHPTHYQDHEEWECSLWHAPQWFCGPEPESDAR